MDDLANELEAVAAKLRGQHDIIPFLEELLPVKDVRFRRLPEEMHSILASSKDYQSVLAGQGPVWLQLETSDRSAELIVYRARTENALYVLAPTRSGRRA